jgi:hypothetical protein
MMEEKRKKPKPMTYEAEKATMEYGYPNSSAVRHVGMCLYAV